MKNIELINESIQKMANKPSDGAIAAAQSIAKEMDDAMASGYEIEWWCWSIEKNKYFAVFNVANKPKIVCRICDENMWDEVFKIFDGVDLKKDKLGLSRKIFDLVNSWPILIEQKD